MKNTSLATTILLAALSISSVSSVAYADCSTCSGCNHNDATVEGGPSAAVMPPDATAEDVNPDPGLSNDNSAQPSGSALPDNTTR